MSIDWFTFAAQIINFLVLVALLHWFLYTPIVRAMQQREEKIAERLEDAARQAAEADQRMQEYQHKSRELDEQREQLLEKAREEAEQRRKQLTKEAKAEVESKREEWQNSLRRERDDLISDIRREAAQLGLQAARQTLSQLAHAELEQQMCDAFAQRIERLDEKHLDEIAQHLGNGESRIVVLSQFEIGEERRQRLRRAIQQQFEFDGEIAFERSNDLMCGLELEVGGYSFDWNMHGFLRDMERRLKERLRA